MARTQSAGYPQTRITRARSLRAAALRLTIARPARTDILAAGLIALLALGLRLAWALYSKSSPLDGRFDDSLIYHLLAIDLRNTHSYNQPFTGFPTAQWPPGYPVFLAALYSVFGVSVVAAKVANAVVGALTVILLYVLGRQLFDRRSAMLGALLLAVMPGQVFFAGLLWSETLFTFIFLLSLVAIVAAKEVRGRPQLTSALAAGALAAAACYVREAGLALLPIAGLYWAWSGVGLRTAARLTGAAALVAMLLLAPWTARNTVKFHGFMLLSSSSGPNLWEGHNESATGGMILVEPLAARTDASNPRREQEISTLGLRDGTTFALSHPRAELHLTKEKIRILYQDDTIGLKIAEDGGRNSFIGAPLRRVLERIADGGYYLVLALTCFGVVLAAVKRQTSPLLILLALSVWTVGYIAFFADPRFHFPIVPLFCLGAGWTLSELWRDTKRLGRRPV